MNDLLDLDFTSTSSTTSTSTSNGSKQPPIKPKGNPNYGGNSFDNLAAASNSSYSNYKTTTITSNSTPNLSRSSSPYLNSTSTSTSGTNIQGINGLRMNDRLSPVTSSTSMNVKPNSNLNSNLATNNDAFASLFPTSSTPSTSSSTISRGTSPSSSNNMGNCINSSGTTKTTTKAQTDPWDFDLLSPTTTTMNSIKELIPPSPSFSISSTSTTPSSVLLPSPSSPSSTSNSNSNGNGRRDSFDYMGIFSQPPPPSLPPTTSSSSSVSTPKLPTVRKTITREETPPPHILGKLIEMGFSILDSTRALIDTRNLENGDWNVELAVSLLASSSSSSTSTFTSGTSRIEEEEEEPIRATAAPQLTGRRAREAASLSLAASRSNTPTSIPIQSPRDLTDQANLIINQASKLSYKAFNLAGNYFGTTGKDVLKKVWGDDILRGTGTGGVGGTTGGGEGGGGGGRPKWMREGDELDFEKEKEKEKVVVKERRSRIPEGGSNSRGQKEVEESLGSSGVVAKGKKEDLLFQYSDEDEEERRGIKLASSFSNGSQQQRQRGKEESVRLSAIHTTSETNRSKSPFPSSTSTSANSISKPSTPLPTKSFPPRLQPPTTPSQLALSLSHKLKGNEFYKLGLFSESITSYSLAIESLPPSHLGLIVLFNNRGMARLKIGEEGECLEDCEMVIRIILGGEGGGGGGGGGGKKVDWKELEREDSFISQNKKGAGGGEGLGFSLREQMAKAISKRAKIYEMKEKFKIALEDFKLLLEGGETVLKFVGGIKIIAEGAGRCRKMLDGGDSSTTTTTTTPTISNQNSSSTSTLSTQKKKPPPPRSIPTSTFTSTSTSTSNIQGSAVAALRETNASLLAEEDLKLSLKDSVDLLLTNWKSGKETNLRALIASLDQVLWKELEWKKVGMGELITEGQVKVRYVRAIGKVHPDKLNVNNTTVEQRMIAGGVFSALNDAFKSSRT